MNDTPLVTRVPLPHVVAEITNAPAGGLDSGPVLRHGGQLLRGVVERLTAAGITPPSATVRALALDGEIADALTRPAPAAQRLAGADLDEVTAAEVAGWITDEARAASLQTGLVAGAVAGRLLDRAAGALFDAFDDLVERMRPEFDPAARVLADATAAGLHAEITAEDVIGDDDLITHYRAVAPAVAVLDRLDDLWHRLALVAGVPLDTGERARRGGAEWLHASTDGPARLPLLADRASAGVTPAAGRSGHARSGTAALVQAETTAASEAVQREHAERQRAARRADADAFLDRAAEDAPDAVDTVGAVR